MTTSILMPGYLYFDGFKYTTSQTLQGPKGDPGIAGPTGPQGSITAGNYLLSGPLNLDGYVTIRYLHTSAGLTSDGYININGLTQLNGLTEINNDVTVAAGNVLITGNASLEIGSGNAGSFTINAGVVSSVASNISFSGISTFSGQITSNGLVVLNDTLSVQHDAEFGLSSVDLLTINSTLNIAGPATFTDSVTIDAASTLTVNVGGSISIDGSLFIGSGATVQADGDVTILGNLNVGTTIFGTPAYNTNTLPNSDGYMSPTADGSILTCAASGGAKNKTITDAGSVPRGSWIILRNSGVSNIQVNSPLGGGMSTLASGECGFFIKMDSANSTWIALFKTPS